MSNNRRRSGLNSSIHCIHWATAAAIVALIVVGVEKSVILAALKLSTPNTVEIEIASAVTGVYAIIVFGVTYLCIASANDERVRAMEHVEVDIDNINAGIQRLDTLGLYPMLPEVLAMFEWTVVEVVKGVALFLDLEEWHDEQRAAARIGLKLVLLLVAIAAAVFAALWFANQRSPLDPFLWGQLAFVTLLPVITQWATRNTLPTAPAPLSSPADAGRFIFCVMQRFGDGRLATKNVLVSMVDKGVDGASAVIDQKIAGWLEKFPMPDPTPSCKPDLAKAASGQSGKMEDPLFKP